MLTGVVLMTYGSPRDLDDVGAYMTRIRGGREPDAVLLAEFRRRYARIGMSPLVDITEQQANGLSAQLGSDYAVAAGMRFSEPSIATAVGGLLDRGADRILGVILSPQYSPLLMGGYDQAMLFGSGLAEHGFKVVAPSRPGYLRTPLSTLIGFIETAARAGSDAVLFPECAVTGYNMDFRQFPPGEIQQWPRPTRY